MIKYFQLLEESDNDEELEDEEDSDQAFWNLSVVDDLKNYSTQKICNLIVCDRYLSLNKEIRVVCMEELAKRRLAGEQFEFEKYIEETLESLPEINISVPNFADIILKMSEMNKK